jgi:hypothetical protein
MAVPVLALALGTGAASLAVASTPAPGSSTGLTFAGLTSSSVAPFGGVQCSNYGTPSKAPRYRGTLNFDTSNVGQGTASAKITLPTTPAGFPLTACDLESPNYPMQIGTTSYYGLMFYVPTGFTVPNKGFFGVNLEEFHFQNIWGSPISWQLHNDHVTLALQTGACSGYTTKTPGCTDHSNADMTNGNPGNLPAEYVIPRGKLVQGAWNEMVMGVDWESNNTGSVQTYYKVKGASAWTPSASITGIPTVQYDSTKGCCYSSYLNETELYTSAVTSPLTVWLNNDVEGSTLASVEGAMPSGSTTTSSSSSSSSSTSSTSTTATTTTQTTTTPPPPTMVPLTIADRGQSVNVNVGNTISVDLPAGWSIPAVNHTPPQLTRISATTLPDGSVNASFDANTADASKLIIHSVNGSGIYGVAITIH